MSRKKLIITGGVLAAVILIGGLLAYFTDTTTPANNVFTVGDKVKIQLNETWEPLDGEGIATNETKTKQPTIENIGDNDAFVFMKVVVPKYYDNEETNGSKWKEAFSYTVNAGWSEVASNTSTANGTSTSSIYVYAYAESADSGTMTTVTPTGATKETTALFDEVTFLPGQDKVTFDFAVVSDYSSTPIESEVKSSMNIDLTGYAIQTTGLSTAKGSSTPATTAEQIYNSCLTASVADGGLGNII